MKENKVIITVVGEDRQGIVAAVSGALAKYNLNILDISQTIVQDYFTMIIVADQSEANIDLEELKEVLEQVGKEIGMVITCQHEDIFRYMHRI